MLVLHVSDHNLEPAWALAGSNEIAVLVGAAAFMRLKTL